jgi:hypothetical protein
MGCGCSRNGAASIAKQKVLNRNPVAPRAAALAPTVIPAQANNIQTFAAMSLPSPELTDADRRRIKKLRDNAITKSLGRLS